MGKIQVNDPIRPREPRARKRRPKPYPWLKIPRPQPRADIAAYGHARGPWPDETWKGWWGDIPPYHVPVFVLTRHAGAPIEMQGGTTFHFVTDGIHAALERGAAAANGKDIRIGGGVATIQQYLRAGLADEIHLAISPVLLGTGERLFNDVDLVELGYRRTEHVATEKATHVFFTR
jgi:dihydrofolate reductase